MSASAALKALLAALLAIALILLLLPVFAGLLFVSAILFYPLIVILALILAMVAALLPQTRRSVSADSKPISASPYALLKTLVIIVGSALLVIALLYAITYVSSLFPSGGTPVNIILLVSEWVAVAIFILFTALTIHRTIREWRKKGSA